MKFLKKKVKPELPWPLTKVTKHPIRFLINKVHMVGIAVVGTYIGVLVVAAVYYLLTQTTDFMNSGWHSLVPDDNLRHDIRNVGEGLLGGVIAQAFIWNHWKIGKPKLWDKIETKLGIPNIHDKNDVNIFQLLITPALVCIYAVPGFFLARWFATDVLGLVLHPEWQAHHWPGFWEKIGRNFTDDLPQKLMGYGAAFIFGRHVAKGVYDDVQGWFATQRVLKGKTTISKFYPPTYQARFNYILEEGVDENMKLKWQVTLLKWSTIAVPLLAGFGWYVLNIIAYRGGAP